MTTATTTATPNTTAQRVEARLAELSKLRAERKDEADLPRTLTMRQVREYLAETAKIDAQIAAVRDAASAVAALPTLDADLKWQEHLKTWRNVLGDELKTFQMPVRGKDANLRVDRLVFSIRLIDLGFSIATFPIVDLSSTPLGELMRESGYAVQGDALYGPRGWRGSTKEVERRIKHQTAAREKAVAALDGVLASDDERAKREAETRAFYSAMATMTIKGDADGTTLLAYDLDGEPLPVEKMTEQQRNAFQRFVSVAEPRPTVKAGDE